MRTSPTHHTNRRGRLRKPLVAVITAAAASASLVPLTATAASAAASSVAITITSGCSTSRAAGTSTTCTIRVTDSNDAADPTGTVSLNLSGTASAVASASSCTLAAASGGGNNYSTCTITATPYTTGTMNTGVTYTSGNTASWTSNTSSATLKSMTVTSPSSFAVASNLASSSSLGTTASIVAYGHTCSVSSGTATGYVLVANNADPNVSSNNPWILGPFTVSGARWSMTTSIPANHPTGTFQAKYVCAKGSVTAAGDSDIVSITSAYTTTISGTGGSAFTTAAARAQPSDDVVVSQGEADDGVDHASISISVNPDDLNDVDQINIVKPNADELKRRTDALLPASSTVSRIGYALTKSGLDRATTDRFTAAVTGGTATGTELATAVLGRSDLHEFATAPDAGFAAGLYSQAFGRDAMPDELAAGVAALQAGTSRSQLVALATAHPEAVARWRNRSYVVAAFQTAAATMPTAEQLERCTDQLLSGWTKVNVVEDIALGAASAAEWNATLPLGRMPALLTRASSPAPAPVVARPPVAAPAPVVAPRPAAKATTAPKASKKRRATVRTSRKAVVRKAPARKVVAKRTATVRNVRR